MQLASISSPPVKGPLCYRYVLTLIQVLTVLPAVAALMAPSAELVSLIKPQFEARREQVRAAGCRWPDWWRRGRIDFKCFAAVTACVPLP